jgi:hypothetical protein
MPYGKARECKTSTIKPRIRSVRGNAPGSPSHKSKTMENHLKQTFLLLGLLLTLAIPYGLWASQAGYSQTRRVEE